jgi:hypothetical protein
MFNLGIEKGPASRAYVTDQVQATEETENPLFFQRLSWDKRIKEGEMKRRERRRREERKGEMGKKERGRWEREKGRKEGKEGGNLVEIFEIIFLHTYFSERLSLYISISFHLSI